MAKNTDVDCLRGGDNIARPTDMRQSQSRSWSPIGSDRVDLSRESGSKRPMSHAASVREPTARSAEAATRPAREWPQFGR